MSEHKLKSVVLGPLVAGLAVFLFACSSNNTSVSSTTTNAANTVSASQPLSGSVKGVMQTGLTYTVADSIVINEGDTLTIQPGVTIEMAKSTGSIFVYGTLDAEGTATSMIKFTCPPAEQDPNSEGKWVGILADFTKSKQSLNTIIFKYCQIEFTGAPNAAGHTGRSIEVDSDPNNQTTIIMQHCFVRNTADDAIGIYGGNASIMYNVVKHSGAPDADSFNIKNGCQGEIAYNVVWASGGNCVKMVSDVTTRPTDMSIHNNTFVASGFRRADEAGYGVMVDASARAEIYDNIFVDNLGDIEITPNADVAHVQYGNNLFWGSVDSLNTATRYYPADGVGKPQPTDLLGQNPLFVSYQSHLYDYSDGSNNYALQAGSPAIGKGLATLPSNPAGTFVGGTTLGAVQ